MQPYLNEIATIIVALPHCKRLGLKISHLEQGRGAMELPPQADFIGNTKRQFMHSALATTLLDTLCGGVASSVYDGGRTVATLDLRIDHLTALDGSKTLFAEAECFHKNDDVAYIQGWAWQDTPDKPVAKASGTFMTNGKFQLQPKAGS